MRSQSLYIETAWPSAMSLDKLRTCKRHVLYFLVSLAYLASFILSYLVDHQVQAKVGESHPMAGTNMINLAIVLRQLGKEEEAEMMYRKALVHCRGLGKRRRVHSRKSGHAVLADLEFVSPVRPRGFGCFCFCPRCSRHHRCQQCCSFLYTSTPPTRTLPEYWLFWDGLVGFKKVTVKLPGADRESDMTSEGSRKQEPEADYMGPRPSA